MTDYDDILNLPVDETIYEMATIGFDEKHNFLVIVAPDTLYNDAYFKVCNHRSYKSCTKVARISFTELKTFIHKGGGKQPWKMERDDLKNLINFMESSPKGKYKEIYDTNWQMTIYQWNHECQFDSHPDYDESIPEGCKPDSELWNNSQFVKLNQEMPDYMKLRF